MRVFPLYYGVLVLAFVLMPLVSPSSGAAGVSEAAPHQAWLWLYATNILLARKEAYLLGGFSHFWSLSVEEHFYLAWPLVIYVCDRRRGMQACLACIVLALACRVWLVLDGGHDVAAYVLTPCRMDALAVGALLALAVRGPGGAARLKAWAAPGFVAFGVATIALLWWKGNLSRMDGTVLVLRFSLAAGLSGALLLLALSATPGGSSARFWNGRLLRVFGRYSYGLYVFHYPLIPLLQRLFPVDELVLWAGSNLAGKLLFIALATAATLGLAMVSWHLYERPFVEIKDVLTGRRVARESPLAVPG